MTLSQNQIYFIITSRKWVFSNLTLKDVKITQVPFFSVEVSFTSSFPSVNQKLAIKRMVPIFAMLIYVHLSTYRHFYMLMPHMVSTSQLQSVRG